MVETPPAVAVVESPAEVEVLGAKIRPIVEAPSDKSWICVETAEGFVLGQSMRVNPVSDLVVDEHTGLVRVASGWIKVELLATSEAPEFVESRRAALTPLLSPQDD